MYSHLKKRNQKLDYRLDSQPKGERQEEGGDFLVVSLIFYFFLLISSTHVNWTLQEPPSLLQLLLLIPSGSQSRYRVCVSLIDIVYMYSFLDNNNNMFVPQRNLQDSNDCFDFLVKPFFPFFRYLILFVAFGLHQSNWPVKRITSPTHNRLRTESLTDRRKSNSLL